MSSYDPKPLPQTCKHGLLARSCELCEAIAEIASLKTLLAKCELAIEAAHELAQKHYAELEYGFGLTLAEIRAKKGGA